MNLSLPYLLMIFIIAIVIGMGIKVGQNIIDRITNKKK
jgi:hypothetical protein